MPRRRASAVERGVAGMPTAFVATYGQGRPVIAIMGEYDALPGISQKASAVKEPLQEGAAGHGCGHNLFGAASLGAAVAIKELMAAGTLKGTIRFLGTPAEESIGGKIYMIREGVFKDVDAVLVWHPSDATKVDYEGAQANVQFFVEFRGRTAHAAADPWNGRSAADAIEAFTHGLNLLREHVKPTVRIHYTVQRAGDVPNVVPDYARILTWVRDSKRPGVDDVFARVQEIARGAALIAGVEHTLTIQTGYTDMNILESGLKLLHENLALVGEPSYTAEEQAFARKLQKATGKKRGRDDGGAGAAEADRQRSAGRIHRCRRRQLGGADAALLSRDRAEGRPVARLAGRRQQPHVDRPQGPDARVAGARRDGRRSLPGHGAARGDQKGVGAEDEGRDLQMARAGRAAADSPALTFGGGVRSCFLHVCLVPVT